MAFSLGGVSQKNAGIALCIAAGVALVGGVTSAVFATETNDTSTPLPPRQPLLKMAEPPLPSVIALAEPIAKPISAGENSAAARYVPNPLSYHMVVNKKFQLRANFAPPDLVPVQVSRVANEPLRREAAAALERLFNGASQAGVSLTMNSAYRSYASQKLLYERYVATRGATMANEFTARPGHSEHQSGLAADVVQGNKPSARNAAAWIAAHAHEYGYIVRYQAGKEASTGYKAESWHIRYVGEPLARTLFASKKTMEEHFGIPGGGY